MKSKDPLYIKDAQNRKLFYYFTPAAVVSNFVPLGVVLYGKDNAQTLNFEYKMWNILTPLSDFEQKDPWARDLLQELIKQIAQEYECEDHIYLCDTVLKDDATAFVNECENNGIKVHLETSTVSEVDHTFRLKKVLDILERMDS